jgi:hypothetical protein
MSIRLRRSVDATETAIRVYRRYRLEDEIIHVLEIHHARPAADGSIATRFEVARGQEGTVATEHPAGTPLLEAP